MLNHHVDLTDNTATSLVRLLLNLQRAFPDWLPRQSFVALSHRNPLDKIPRHLKKATFQLARLLDGGKLLKDAPRFHVTFESFLLESSHRSPFSIELTPPERDFLLATTYLKIMDEELPLSFPQNKDVPDLKALSEANISSHLRYACRHWAQHVSQLENLDTDLVGTLSRFFQARFLHWLQVMSVLALPPVEALQDLDPARVSDSIIQTTVK